MDYKFIILLLVIIGLIIFFTRELDNIKSEISDKLDKIASYVDNSSKNTLIKMQNGFGMCVTKLKTINGDYIEQVRKMNDYGNQPLTNMSNHYTDTDSQGNGMKFLALSDCKMSKTSAKKQGGESFYLSEDEPKKQKKHLTDEFKLILPATEDNQTKKTENKFILNPDLIDDEINHITSESISHSQKENYINEENINLKNDDDNCNNDNEYKENSEENLEENVNEDQNANAHTDNIKEYSFEDIEQSENDVDDISVENSEHSSNYGSISFGSKKKAKQIGGENESVTSTIKKMTINNLLSQDMYTADNLKKIAKELTIPIYYKNGSSRRQLKKDELYDKIRGHLTEINRDK